MDCHKLIYKSCKTTTPYQNYLNNLRLKQQQQKKKYVYGRILKFQQSRYPQQLLNKLQQQINPFQLSLDKLKQQMLLNYPQYSSDIVNQSVQHIFLQKYQQANIIIQSPIIIQDGYQYIRNGRKLMKQDFKYQYHLQNKLKDNLPLQTERKKRSIQKNQKDRYIFNKSIPNPQSDRLKQFHSPQKPYVHSKQMQAVLLTQRFNQILNQQLKQQSSRYDNIELIYQDNPNDLINADKKQGNFTGRSQTQSFLNFKQGDIIHNPQDVGDTQRSDIQKLQLLLSVNALKEHKNADTSRSKKSSYSLKINKQIMDNLYTAQGNIKLNIIKRALNKIKKQI